MAEIAAPAGLTERTFFRHFADKREVLFDGGDRLQATVAGHTQAAPASATHLDAVAEGIEAAGLVFPSLDFVRRRQALILANPALQERELIKLASLATALAEALRRRGVADAAAELAAETGIALLRATLTRWIEDPAERAWEVHARETVDRLRRLTAERQPAAATCGRHADLGSATLLTLAARQTTLATDERAVP